MNHSQHGSVSFRSLCWSAFFHVSLLINLSAGGTYNGGRGIEAEPYLIADAGDLLEMSRNPLDWDKHFALVSDIDMSAYSFTQALISPHVNTTSEYYLGARFIGVFNGNGHTIKNLKINGGSNNYIGFFGYVGSNGIIKNLQIEDISYGGTSYIGGIAGLCYQGTIEACHVTGTVVGKGKHVGGLFGQLDEGSIQSCRMSGSVEGYEDVGGLVGNQFNSTIQSSYATGSASGFYLVGGLVGTNYSIIYDCSSSVNLWGKRHVGGLTGLNHGSLDSCYATGNVTGMEWEVGGLSGTNHDTISLCYATGDVSGHKNSVGGLVGFNFGMIEFCYATGNVWAAEHQAGGLVGYSWTGTIHSCYAVGNVTGYGNDIGGLAGLHYGKIHSCYATGKVSGSGDCLGGLVGQNNEGHVFYSYSTGEVSGTGIKGGLIGQSSGSVIAGFWDVQGSGLTESDGGVGLSPEEMQATITYQNAGWCIPEWKKTDGQYPRLIWEGTDGDPILPLAGQIDGAGTQEDPFLVGTPEDLIFVGHASILWDKHFRLTGDIDMAGYQFSHSLIAPSGFTQFTGSFDGKGYGIRNLTIDAGSDDYVGFIGHIGQGGTITNLRLENITVNGNEYVGGLAGYSDGNLIDSCHITGSIHGTGQCVGGLIGCNNEGSIRFCLVSGEVVGGGLDVGGLAGNNRGAIEYCDIAGDVSGTNNVGGVAGSHSAGLVHACVFSGNVAGDWAVGGVVGNLWQGTCSLCKSTGQVTGLSYIGGLAGDMNESTVTACCSTAHVQGEYYIGGLVGYNEGNIECSYATGDVNGLHEHIGGLVGYNDSATIDSCYSTGIVAGDLKVGGLTGSNISGTIALCYARGPVSGTRSSTGGIVGFNQEGQVLSCPWDIQTSHQVNGQQGFGLTTDEMKTVLIFSKAGWSNTHWRMAEGQYPTLEWQDVGGDIIPPIENRFEGQGTIEEPILIRSCEDLFNLSGPVNILLEKHIKLCVDLDLSEYRFTSSLLARDVSASSGFQGTGLTGTFDGNGHSIRNLTIESTSGSFTGFIGYMGAGGRVTNLHLDTIQVNGDQAVGGLVGYNAGGTIDSCTVTGDITGSVMVGGLVGHNAEGRIRSCGTTTNVTGYDIVGGLIGKNYRGWVETCGIAGYVKGISCVGGLVGTNSGAIDTCYARADVEGYTTVGGLLGNNENGVIRSCYSTGVVSGQELLGGLVGRNYPTGLVHYSFWDIEASKQGFSAGGTGKTTAEMKTISTYREGEWGEKSWFMVEGYYPHLPWEDTNGQSIPRSEGYPEGNGTTDDPFLVSSLEEILLLSEVHDLCDKHIKLVSDIELAGTPFSKPLFAPDIDRTSSGFQGTPYTGIFDGDGHVIRNLSISAGSDDYVGLIGSVGEGGIIKNLRLENATITGKNFVGGLAGRNEKGLIHSCYVEGNIKGSECVGGVAGQNMQTIRSCSILGSVNGNINVGGLAGRNYSTIESCHAEVNVSATEFVGGLVGRGDHETIKSCHAGGPVKGGNYVGGLVGNSYLSTLELCSATGNVTGQGKVGGLAGGVFETVVDSSYATGRIESVSGYYPKSDTGGLMGEMQGYSSVISCYATGDVVGNVRVGGLVGTKWMGVIARSYASGHVTGKDGCGGLVGSHSGGSIHSCYAEGRVSGTICVGGLAGSNDHATIDSCYCSGPIMAEKTSQFVGCLAGTNYDGEIRHCYSISKWIGNGYASGLCGRLYTQGDSIDVANFWDIEKTGTVFSVNGYGKTTAQMQSISTFTNAGWDFDNTWWIREGRDYPKLSWQPFGDLNNDNRVNAIDLAIMSFNWLRVNSDPDFNNVCDLSGNDTVDMADLSILTDAWLKGLQFGN